jgi:hypothetical protein
VEAAMPTIALVDDDRNILTSVSIALEADKKPQRLHNKIRIVWKTSGSRGFGNHRSA